MAERDGVLRLRIILLDDALVDACELFGLCRILKLGNLDGRRFLRRFRLRLALVEAGIFDGDRARCGQYGRGQGNTGKRCHSVDAHRAAGTPVRAAAPSESHAELRIG